MINRNERGYNLDTALILRKNYDENRIMSETEIHQLLSESKLIKKISETQIKKPLPVIWNLIALSEIPYSYRLNHTEKVINYINEQLFTGEGYGLTGKNEGLLPCYNSMIAEAMIKLGYSHFKQVEASIDWIKKYQLFERDSKSTWPYKGTEKYGGCFKSVPCFIGVVKALKALAYYNKATDGENKECKTLLEKGMNYVLSHQLYQRRSTGDPINHHILDMAFPPSYQLNIIELLELAYITGNIQAPQCQSGIAYVTSKRKKEGYFKINYTYKAEGFVSFDKKGDKGEWITYLLDKYLGSAVI